MFRSKNVLTSGGSSLLATCDSRIRLVKATSPLILFSQLLGPLSALLCRSFMSDLGKPMNWPAQANTTCQSLASCPQLALVLGLLGRHLLDDILPGSTLPK